MTSWVETIELLAQSSPGLVVVAFIAVYQVYMMGRKDKQFLSAIQERDEILVKSINGITHEIGAVREAVRSCQIMRRFPDAG